jgi:hypothetical protein
MDNVEMARDGFEHAHGGAHHDDPWTRRAAMLIAILAAAAVVGEMSANDAQTHYLAAHIGASDMWAQYQAKSIRRSLFAESAEIITALHGDQAKVDQARQDAARMQSEAGHDGMAELSTRAAALEHERDEELRRHQGEERGVRGLQIGIVLCSLYVVTRLRFLLIGGGVLGVVASLYALAAGLGFL